jgi:hypothetical protein
VALSASVTVTTPAHQAVSASVAEAGTVLLLKNDRATPLLRASGAGKGRGVATIHTQPRVLHTDRSE